MLPDICLHLLKQWFQTAWPQDPFYILKNYWAAQSISAWISYYLSIFPVVEMKTEGFQKLSLLISFQFSSVQSLSCVWLFAAPWPAAHQASLSITNSWSLHKLMSIESVMPSNHLILVIPFSSCLQSFPASGSFLMSQLFASGGQSIAVSASASVLPMNTQDWFPLRWTGWIPLLSKGLSRVFSNTTVQKHQFFGAQFSLWSSSHIHTWLLEKPYLWYRHDKVILYHGYRLKGRV